MRLYSKTQTLIETMIAQRIVPGANYALLSQDQVFTATLGYSQIAPTLQQLSPAAEYDLASLTKVVGTTNVFLKLYDQGKLNFTESVSSFIPEFHNERVRLRHLLTHTSGIRGWIENRDQLDQAQLLDAIVHLPVTDEFNTKMRYADTNFILLGLVLEQIYGQAVQDVIEQEVLTPCHYHHLTFEPNPADCVPTTYVDGQLLQGVVHDPKARVLNKRCASAGMFGTLADLIRMGQGLTGIDPTAVPFSQQTASDLFDVKTPRNVHARSWGWDLVFDQAGYPILVHTGFTGTLMIVDRVKQTGLVLLTNRVHPTGHNQLFLAMRHHIIDSFVAENSANKKA